MKSKEGEGSCFTATIFTTSKPPYEKEMLLATYKSMNNISPNSTLKALVIEDFPINQTINSEMLKKYGFVQVEIGDDGQKGLEIFKSKQPNYFDIITMDLEMPVMKGKEAMMLIRKWETEKNLSPTKIIVISGNAIEREMNECLDRKGSIRADAFLTKPCGYNILSETITRLLGRTNHQKELQLQREDNMSSIERELIISTRKKSRVHLVDDKL